MIPSHSAHCRPRLFTAYRSGLALMALCLVFSATQAQNRNMTPAPNAWEQLGSRKVNFRLDKDEITVGQRRGAFAMLRLKVRGASIHLRSAEVIYRNGQRQNLPVKKGIPISWQRWHLEQYERRGEISKVVLVYQTRQSSRRRATVELWGRR